MYQVLLVDDEINIVQWLSKSIPWKTYGFEVCEICTGGLQALTYLSHHTVDLVITDIRMPGLNGLELVKKLYECSPAIQTIILSGYNQFEYAQNAIRYGVKGFLLKPLDPNELCELLQKISARLSTRKKESSFAEKEDLDLDFFSSENRIKEVISYLSKNYNKDLCLKTTAELFHFHPAYLGKIFKDATGSSFSTYLNQTRIQQLKKLLNQSKLPINQLLESVGYRNYDYFYTIFKKYEGISFSEYRSTLIETKNSSDYNSNE